MPCQLCPPSSRLPLRLVLQSCRRRHLRASCLGLPRAAPGHPRARCSCGCFRSLRPWECRCAVTCCAVPRCAVLCCAVRCGAGGAVRCGAVLRAIQRSADWVHLAHPACSVPCLGLVFCMCTWCLTLCVVIGVELPSSLRCRATYTQRRLPCQAPRPLKNCCHRLPQQPHRAKAFKPRSAASSLQLCASR
jgi:hypothetical protein